MLENVSQYQPGHSYQNEPIRVLETVCVCVCGNAGFSHFIHLHNHIKFSFIIKLSGKLQSPFGRERGEISVCPSDA